MTTYSTGKTAKLLGVSVRTLQQWDRDGKLEARRNPAGRRFYTEAQIRAYMQEVKPEDRRVTVVYCRVSSQAQRPDLRNQKIRLEEFCAAKGISIDEWIEEIGGGLNFKRPKFLKLFDRIAQGLIKTLIVAHKDRLARFGFDWLLHICKTKDCQLIVMNHESLSPEREMVEDLMAITHCFSARLYGLRNYKKALKQALDEDHQSP